MNAADEVLSETWTDGAGRVRLSRVPHTFSGGSTATWAGTITEYDILGRVKRQSVPTEVDANFDPAGDDQTRGWLWTHQRYDWMGRVVRRIATDGDPNALENDSDVLISYAGCGCAGGLETTIEGELVPRTDGTSGNARRKQKVYQDILGRTYKTETYEWDGSTVYSTSTAKFNGRDQVILGRQYAGDTSSTTFQDTTATFDGHGRMATSHRPEQLDNSNNLKYTTYNYNADDSISSVVDARGATTHYQYNSRALIEEVSWSVPAGSNITVPATVEFEYDALGNRTQMVDETGTSNYSYDQLSRISSETKQFTQTASDVGMPNQVTLSYEYGLSRLRKLTYPGGKEVEYSYFRNGRLSRVDGVGFSGNYGQSGIAFDYQYRAWGAPKQIVHPNGKTISYTFNERLQAATFELSGVTTKTYDYRNDGFVRYVSDTDARHDRAYEYDQIGRTISTTSNHEARGQTGPASGLPIKSNTGFNAFGDVVSSSIQSWGAFWSDSGTYSNSRRTDPILPPFNNSPTWEYDADGRVTVNRTARHENSASYVDTTTYLVDAAGHKVFAETVPEGMAEGLEKLYEFDGDGKNVIQRENHQSWIHERTKRYEVWSSVMNKPVAEYAPTCTTSECTFSEPKLNIYDTNGSKIAVGPHLQWETRAPTNSSVINVFDHPLGQQVRRMELTPFASEISFEPPDEPQPPDDLPQSNPEMGSIEAEHTAMCTLNGTDILCNQISNLLRSGECEYASCSIRDSHGDYIFAPLGRHGPDISFGPNETIGDPCRGLEGSGLEGCMLAVATLRAENRANLDEAIHQNDLNSVLKWRFEEASGQTKNLEGSDKIGLRKTNTRAEFSESTFIKCLEDFGVSPTKISTIIQNEPFESLAGLVFYRDNLGWRGWFTGTRKSDGQRVSVNVDGYTYAVLGRDGKAIGLRPSVYSGTVYIASGITDFMFALATAIHEIGNGIDAVTRSRDRPRQTADNPLLREFDSDSGMALEECVFGGYVGRDGYIYAPYRRRGEE